MLTARVRWRMKSRSRPCSHTASGVVLPSGSSLPGQPLPSVPTTPQRRPSRVSACAIQWLHEVLPFVPVTPTIHNRALGRP